MTDQTQQTGSKLEGRNLENVVKKIEAIKALAEVRQIVPSQGLATSILAPWERAMTALLNDLNRDLDMWQKS